MTQFRWFPAINPDDTGSIFSLEEVQRWTKRMKHDDRLVRGEGNSLYDRVYRNRPIQIAPDVWTGDAKYQKLVMGVYNDLVKIAPQSDTLDGIMDSRAVAGDWTVLLNDPGYSMDPVGYPDVLNVRTAASRWDDPHDIELFTQLFSLLFVWDPVSSYAIPRDSAMGFPDQSREPRDKLDAFYNVANEMDTFLTMVAKDDLEGQQQRYNQVHITFNATRAQPDKRKKIEGKLSPAPRVALSLEQALHIDTGTDYADKEIPGSPLTAMRKRIAYGVPARVNVILGAVFSVFHTYAMRTYPHTWKHRGADDLDRKIKSSQAIVSMDATEFDKSMSLPFVELLGDYLADKVMDERFVKHLMRAWSSPVFVPSPIIGKRGHQALLGNPWDLSTYKVFPGLPSGIGPNSFFGKIWGVGNMLIGLRNVFGMFKSSGSTLRSEIDTFLRGDYPGVSLLNSSDDSLLCFKDPDQARTFRGAVADGSMSPYLEMTADDYSSFLGDAIYQGETDWKVGANVISYVSKILTPERGIYSFFRKYPAIGHMARMDVYKTAPLFPEVWEVVEKHFYDVYSLHLTPTWQVRAEQERMELGSATEVDRLVLADPSRIYYRFEPDEVSQSLRETLVLTIPAHHLEQLSSIIK